MLYLCIALLCFALALYDVFIQKNIPKHFYPYMYAVLWLFIFLIIGFRGNGFDYDNYSYIFSQLDSPFWRHNADVVGVETGYAWLNATAGSYRVLLLIMAACTVALLSTFTYKHSPKPFFTISLILVTCVYQGAMGQHRQALAMGLVLWACVYRKQLAVFLPMIALAATFHLSSLLALLIPFIPGKTQSRKLYLGLLLVALASNLLLGTIVVNVIGAMTGLAADKLAYYIQTEEGMTFGLNMAMLLRLASFSLFWINREAISSYKYGSYFMNIYFLSLLIYLGLGFLPQVAGRGGSYFYLFESFVAAMLVAKVERYKVLYVSFFLLISAYRQVSFFSEWSHFFIPYQPGIPLF